VQQVQKIARWKQEVRGTFGARLRELRHLKGVSQEQLALQCGLDRSYVGQIERGERNLSLENIHKLANALKVQPSELLLDVGSNSLLRGTSK
jgi:transcriptional regulator with XRE-family HTH domain